MPVTAMLEMTIDEMQYKIDARNKAIEELLVVAEQICNQCEHNSACLRNGKDPTKCESWKRIEAARELVRKQKEGEHGNHQA